MEIVTILTASVLPTAFWLWLFVRRDMYPEPAWLLARTFAWGMVAWVVAAALEIGLQSGRAPLVALLLAAVTEETAKWMAASTAEREREFDEPMDGLVYAVTAALGFALLENLTYGLRFGAQVAVWHGVVTSLAHALFSAPIGYALARVRFGGPRRWRVWALGISVTLHLSFNGLLTGGAGLEQFLALAAVLALMGVLAGRLYRRLGRP
ncbi:PrsW family intramembrane metalloprotease [Deinococcus maricopensis]|uniref:Protease PrsW n=1 Tax=Deinococcus maricopensis (strain DSM 21211 / LMG 22137 / NRRL B-23946 / LB-34) TaxID=709986 RepID=E8U2Z3_DEIML|nr:PrsW family glutamic-type intramembrane protease [Deinococcus maricopensis]ADV65731.1 membrane protein-like protein [Deinococcus maricopensis DSM 21211]